MRSFSVGVAWTRAASLIAMSILTAATGCVLGNGGSGGSGAGATGESTSESPAQVPTSSETKTAEGPRCAPHEAAPEDPVPDDPAVPPGAPSEFVSANAPFFHDVFPGEEEEEEEEEEREVEEGDIYRVLGDGYLLALTPAIGLEVVDIHDLARPRVTGRTKVSGQPIDMYVVGNRALVLMNGFEDYALTPGTIEVKHRTGATGLLVDVSDRTTPRILSQFYVPGAIQSSRLAHGERGDSLYVASTHVAYVKTTAGSQWMPETMVTSFDIGTDAMSRRGQLSLGGYVTAISAQENTLLVARSQNTWSTSDGDVALVDISATDGSMVLRDSVAVRGYVASQFHMDLRHGILRVVSGPRWADGTASRLQTFAVGDTGTLSPVEYRDFAKGEQIYGAVFLEDRAFAVTFYRRDPFHAFAIDPAGKITEKSQFIVSGWNDFFRPVLNASRLVGIGFDGTSLAVSLYDTTDLDNEKPLLARTVVDNGTAKGWNWSEATWDHRAFTVLDDAVDVKAATGESERGLVLLPFSNGYWFDSTARSGVQIFTYSATTMTRRGVMQHPEAVRRAFRLDDKLGANLSDSTLSIQDESDLDHPSEISRLDLAPSYSAIYAFGDYRVRVMTPSASGSRGEVIPRTGPADQVDPIAQFAIPVGRLVKVGDLLVSLSYKYDGWPTATTTVTVVDLTCPTSPRVLAPFQSTAIPPPQSIWADGVWMDGLAVTRDAITFVSMPEVVGEKHKVHACSDTVTGYPACVASAPWSATKGAPSDDCSYWDGIHTCIAVDDGSNYCAGGFAWCTRALGSTTCAPATAEWRPLTTSLCADWEEERRTQQIELTVLDLTKPATPTLFPRISLPADEEGVGVVSNGHHEVFVTVKRPMVGKPGSRPLARYFVRRLDLAVPSKPVLGDTINVPGIVVDAYGQTLVTRDARWGSQYMETAVAQSVVRDRSAHLVNDLVLHDRSVESLLVDDHRLALVTSGSVWSWRGGHYNSFDSDRMLGILGLSTDATATDAAPHLPLLFSGPMTMADDRWSSLSTVSHDRAFVTVSGGAVMLDLSVPTRPQAQAFFPGGSSNVLFDQGEILVPAAQKGIHQILLDHYGIGVTPIGYDDEDVDRFTTKARKRVLKKTKKTSVDKVPPLVTMSPGR